MLSRIRWGIFGDKWKVRPTSRTCPWSASLESGILVLSNVEITRNNGVSDGNKLLSGPTMTIAEPSEKIAWPTRHALSSSDGPRKRVTVISEQTIRTRELARVVLGQVLGDAEDCAAGDAAQICQWLKIEALPWARGLSAWIFSNGCYLWQQYKWAMQWVTPVL